MNADELRQLDREMAAIMGWHQVGALVSGSPEPRLAWEASRIPALPLNQWHPTSDIRQAWMVVEALRAKGYLITLDLFPNFTWVTVGREDRVTGEAYGEAVLAICLAAKATMGER